MMKIFIKTINNCRECPNVSFRHFDGEGESAPYQYNYPECKAVKDWESVAWQKNKIKVNKSLGLNTGNINIPNWCPLKEG